MTAPSVPKDLHTDPETRLITVRWTQVSGASSYDLEVDGEIYRGIKGTEFIHDRLKPNTMHIYRIRAVGSGGTSTWSDIVTGSTIPEISALVGKDTQFNFVVVAPQQTGITERMITVTYDPEQLEVIDLSANTDEINLTTGAIEGTNLTVLVYEPGLIVFYATRADRTVVNSIRFMSKTNDYSPITYRIE